MTSADATVQRAPLLGFARHDHGACVTGALALADKRCAAENIRFTPVRRRVLEILLQEHRALGAYAILDHLRGDGFGGQPPVAYRALDFLVQQGFAHRIERLNAFIACAQPGQRHSPAFMICRLCGTVAEAATASVAGALGDAAQASGFEIECTVVEAEGICPDCSQKDTPCA